MNRNQRRAIAKGLSAPRTAEARYVKGLRGMARSWATLYEKALAPAIAANAVKIDAGDAVVRLDAGPYKTILKGLAVAVQTQIKRGVDPLYSAMFKAVNTNNRNAMDKLIGITEKSVGVAKVAQVGRIANVKLVQDAHRAYADQVAEIFLDPANVGIRVEVLTKKLLERGDVSESRAELIARDQTLKTNGQITQARAEDAGITTYQWSTSQDEAVRGNPTGKYPKAKPSHWALEGKTFSYDDPPEPGNPGQDYQCRCIAIPIITPRE